MLVELELQQDYLPTRELETIYLGGGTPSLLDASELQQLFQKIDANSKNFLEIPWQLRR